MNAQDIHNLQEAYMEVVQNQQLDELSVNKMLAYVKKGEKNREDLNKKWDEGTATPKERKKVFDREEGERRASDKVKKKTGKRPYQMNALDRARYAVTKEQIDLYDIILSHLLDEGYAETPEAAEAIMVNMGEDWRDSIIEAYDPKGQDKLIKKMGSLRKPDPDSTQKQNQVRADRAKTMYDKHYTSYVRPKSLPDGFGGPEWRSRKNKEKSKK